jgi:hypothetical protein
VKTVEGTTQAPELVGERAVPVDRRTRRGLGRVAVKSASEQAKFDEGLRRRRASREDTADKIEADRQTRALKAEARSERMARARSMAAKLGRVVMITVPIVSPMAVAWTGQAGFAGRVLGWPLAAALLYAAAYELSTVFCAWMSHEAKADGDRGTVYRVATWVFCFGAAAQQWWHYSINWEPTSRSVIFSSMSIVGLAVWELYERLISRRALREAGRIGKARPKIDLARWVRYPRISWHAWSISILHDISTLDEAWTRAEIEIGRRRTQKDLRREVRELRKQLEIGKSGPEEAKPISTPPGDVVTLDREPVKAVAAAGESRPDQGKAELPAIEARPTAASEEAGDFTPTSIEKQALANMVSGGLSINRDNCATAVRELGGGIATKRARDLAVWGREHKDNGFE